MNTTAPVTMPLLNAKLGETDNPQAALHVAIMWVRLRWASVVKLRSMDAARKYEWAGHVLGHALEVVASDARFSRITNPSRTPLMQRLVRHSSGSEHDAPRHDTLAALIVLFLTFHHQRFPQDTRHLVWAAAWHWTRAATHLHGVIERAMDVAANVVKEHWGACETRDTPLTRAAEDPPISRGATAPQKARTSKARVTKAPSVARVPTAQQARGGPATRSATRKAVGRKGRKLRRGRLSATSDETISFEQGGALTGSWGLPMFRGSAVSNTTAAKGPVERSTPLSAMHTRAGLCVRAGSKVSEGFPKHAFGGPLETAGARSATAKSFVGPGSPRRHTPLKSPSTIVDTISGELRGLSLFPPPKPMYERMPPSPPPLEWLQNMGAPVHKNTLEQMDGVTSKASFGVHGTRPGYPFPCDPTHMVADDFEVPNPPPSSPHHQSTDSSPPALVPPTRLRPLPGSIPRPDPDRFFAIPEGGP